MDSHRGTALSHLSIKARLIVLAVYSVVSALVVTGVVLLFYNISNLRSSTVEQLQLQARMLGFNSTGALAFQDAEAATQLLSSLRTFPSVESAWLYDEQGTVLATYPADLKDRVSLSGLPHEFHSDGYLLIRHPVRDQGTKVGDLVLRSNLDGFYSGVRDNALLLAGVMLFSLCLSVFLSLRIQTAISEPIAKLVRVARKVTEQDYSARVQWNSPNEFGRLCTTFDQMLDVIERSEEELQTANLKLEDRVERRTAQLTEEIQERQKVLVELEAANKAAEAANAEIEDRVRLRTKQLESARNQLEKEFEEHRKTQIEREELYVELANASRQAGMAEVATGVLHNAGNVLNSVNVSANLLTERASNNRVGSLVKAADVIAEHEHDLATFLTEDKRGKHFSRLLKELAANLASERDEQINELRELTDNLAHVKEIINMQQAFASVRGTTESVDLRAIIDDALKINDTALFRHSVDVVCEFDDIPATVVTERHKILQILVNLITNAKQAFTDLPRENRQITIRVQTVGEQVEIQICDNGVGISEENIARIFTHGFTTKAEGHGFGLHSCALSAQELGGTLSVKSAGHHQGATFKLRIPINKESLCKV